MFYCLWQQNQLKSSMCEYRCLVCITELSHSRHLDLTKPASRYADVCVALLCQWISQVFQSQTHQSGWLLAQDLTSEVGLLTHLRLSWFHILDMIGLHCQRFLSCFQSPLLTNVITFKLFIFRFCASSRISPLWMPGFLPQTPCAC